MQFDQNAKLDKYVYIDLPEKRYTPYMHYLGMHASEFLKLHWNINIFMQQGLEKLNDMMTIHFHHFSNHREQEAFKQMLQKRNR